MNDALRVLVVGTGDMARTHLRGYSSLERARVRAVAGRNVQKAKTLATEFRVDAVYPSVDAALDAENFDIASVCLPTHLHASTTVRLLEAGVHVLTEKPIALELEDARRMMRTAREQNRKLSVVFNRRFSSGFDELRQKIDELGSPLFYRVEDLRMIRPKRAMHDVRQNGGPVIDCACHDFDLLYKLFGPVESVYATGYAFAKPEVLEIPVERVAIDTASILLRFVNGFAAEIYYCWGLPERDHYRIRRSFMGPEGIVTALGDFGQTVEYYRKDGVSQVTGSFVPDGHAKQIARFVESVIEDTGVPVPPEDGLRALRLSLLALQSIETGKIMKVDEKGGYR